MSYRAPVRDIAFALDAVAGIGQVAATGAFPDYDADVASAVLDAAGQVSEEVLAPLNGVGDREGCTLENGVVRTPTGFLAAFDQMREGGWTALDCDPEIAEIDVLEHKEANWGESFDETEVEDIIVHATRSGRRHLTPSPPEQYWELAARRRPSRPTTC